MNNTEIVMAVEESNLPLNVKCLVLSSLGDKNWAAAKEYEKMMSSLILAELSKTEPRRVKDVAAALGGDYTVQRLTQIMTDLVRYKRINREVVDTGRTLVIKYQCFNYTTCRYEWKEKEIPEIYAVFTLA